MADQPSPHGTPHESRNETSTTPQNHTDALDMSHFSGAPALPPFGFDDLPGHGGVHEFSDFFDGM